MRSLSLHADQVRAQGRPRVFFYVQHLLGTGHFRRAQLLAEAMRDAGLAVRLISGGLHGPEPPAGIDLVRLPALRVLDHTFTELVDESGRVIDSSWRSSRRGLLLGHFRDFRPDVLIIESFPFGRRKLRFELLPLLDAAGETRPRPLALCSVRDIVQVKTPRRLAETVEVLRTRFDGVLVHADPAFVRFEESFAPTDRIRHLIHYTGYVAPPSPPDSVGSPAEVVVSAGGGAVAERLLQTAIDARGLSRLYDAPWRILVGPNAPEPTFDALRKKAGAGISVERNRSDFPSLLARCLVSVSQAGYNTVMDLVTARAPAVVVPFEGTGETEQALRAHKLQQAGLAEVVRERDLSPQTLAAAIDRGAARGRMKTNTLDLSGAAASAAIVTDAWHRHRDTHGVP